MLIAEITLCFAVLVLILKEYNFSNIVGMQGSKFLRHANDCIIAEFCSVPPLLITSWHAAKRIFSAIKLWRKIANITTILSSLNGLIQFNPNQDGWGRIHSRNFEQV
jgi:hypothetical protein